MSVLLPAARTEVSARAEEFLAGVATGGSTTTVVDANKLYAADGYWDECNILFTSGANNNLERRVSTQVGTTLTLYSAVTAVVANDTYELRRRFTIAEVDRAINRAINVLVPDLKEHVRVDVTAVSSTYTYAVPIASNPGMAERGLVGIEYGPVPNPTTKPLPRLPADLYSINEDYDATTTNANVKTLQLNFNPGDGYIIRFVFDGPVANVSAVTDRIHIDLPELELFYTQAVAELWRIAMKRSSGAALDHATKEAASADAYADRIRRSLGLVRKPAPMRRTVFRTTGF